MQRKMVLASSSPRRRELLSQAGFSFKIDPPGIGEDMKRKLSPRLLVQELAFEKASAVAIRHTNALVIGADTVVSLGNKTWSKPESAKEARLMLSTLQGKTHDVWTGFCIIDTGSGKRVLRAVKTRVTMRALSPKEIERHIQSGEALSGAGGYMIQKGGAALIERVSGDYTNIIGLPIPSFLKALTLFGAQV